jgi:hypothetical protein
VHHSYLSIQAVKFYLRSQTDPKLLIWALFLCEGDGRDDREEGSGGAEAGWRQGYHQEDEQWQVPFGATGAGNPMLFSMQNTMMLQLQVSSQTLAIATMIGANLRSARLSSALPAPVPVPAATFTVPPVILAARPVRSLGKRARASSEAVGEAAQVLKMMAAGSSDHSVSSGERTMTRRTRRAPNTSRRATASARSAWGRAQRLRCWLHVAPPTAPPHEACIPARPFEGCRHHLGMDMLWMCRVPRGAAPEGDPQTVTIYRLS